MTFEILSVIDRELLKTLEGDTNMSCDIAHFVQAKLAKKKKQLLCPYI